MVVAFFRKIKPRFSFFLKLSLLILSLSLFSLFLLAQEPAPRLKKELLMEDVRQLADILEKSHPDPYLRGGGKIAFHRRLQETLLRIPEEGLTVKEFFIHLLPFVASVKDGHTFLLPPWPAQSGSGLPFGLNIVEESIYVEKVYFPDHKNLIGARLEAINNIPVSRLLDRLKTLVGWDNEYQLLTYFCRFLDDQSLLSILLPEWDSNLALPVNLCLPSGEKKSLFISLKEKTPPTPFEASTKIILPSTEKIDFVYAFLDSKRETCLLRIDGMFSYRENFEFFRAMGVAWAQAQAAKVYSRIYQTKAPEDLDKLIAAIPAATEVFRNLVIEMKKAQTKKLIIDLRKNSGGNSLLVNILAYFLFPEEAMKKAATSFSIKKYSDLYFANYQNDSLENINQRRRINLTKEDYDFAEDPYFKTKSMSIMERENELGKYLQMSPTFYAEYMSGQYKNYYRPPELMVISSPWTYSSGYTLMSLMYKMGAKIVGVASGQSGNCFGDTLMFQLKNSGLRGYVSYKLFLDFPEDPKLGYILRPHRELTYEDLIRHHFDPNTSVLLALEK